MHEKEIKIGAAMVGREHEPFVIAEMSGNHNQSLERALQIVDAAADAGAHALKLQTYTPDTITIDMAEGEFFISNPESLWKGTSLYDLYKQAYTPWEWHTPIFDRCHERGMVCFSSPFDETAVDFLEGLGCPAYKIASFENIHLPLLRKVGATGKPVIVSTGMASLAELDDAVRTLRQAGCRELVLLKCTSTYPATPENSNLRTIPHLRELFGVQVGLSDHTMGVGVAVASIALGATVVEKHFTLSRAEGGVDAAFSLEPGELEALVKETRQVWQALGGVTYGPTEAERKSLVFRRSVYAVKDIVEGELFSYNNLRVIRPGAGLPPKYIDILVGKRAARDIKRGTAMKWEFIG